MEIKRNKQGAKMYDDDLPIVAICYDFDRTLSPREMQEYTIIPQFNISAPDFWKESNTFATQNGMDKMLASLYTVLAHASKNGVKISEADFTTLGSKVELFAGVETWFEHINKVGEQVGVHIEHYIISAGIKEIIDGSKISKHFEQIYASSFYYDTYGKPIWAKQVINAASKTQYLFRVNKGCLDIRDEHSVHDYMQEDKRRIPFGNIIYIGDSETDIPTMKILTNQGGYSIGVYSDQNGLNTVSKLLLHKRVTHFAKADYRKGQELDTIITNIIKNIRAKETLERITNAQKKEAEKLKKK
ncbi:MAG: haloacid dehalogenase-like hydrolase [Firmicutes bacterium]|nr:haloacid dehalogenase-like hydrolase [Bacillota bacterium]